MIHRNTHLVVVKAKLHPYKRPSSKTILVVLPKMYEKKRYFGD